MEKLYYKKINQSGQKISKQQYIDKLSNRYNCKPFFLENENKSNNKFLIYLDALKDQIIEYNKTAKKYLKLKEINYLDYIDKDIKLEINSNLRIEGVNSTKKIVDGIIKNKNKELNNKMFQNEIEVMILNMDIAMRFILRTNDISINNIFVLYSILTKDLNLKENKLSSMKFYREQGVKIGSDQGLDWKKIPIAMNLLVKFINSNQFNNQPIIKALICHYIFAHIHPYFDFNGRMSRLIHLWVLKKIDPEKMWENIHLNQSINAYKDVYYKAFNKMNTAKELNVDLTLWISYLLDIFINHNNDYIKMKQLANQSKVKLNDKCKTFLMHIILETKKNPDKYFSKKDFRKIFFDYSNTVADRAMKILEKSKLFKIRISKSNEFKLK